jgi:LPS export ABC transporter protein LptC
LAIGWLKGRRALAVVLLAGSAACAGDPPPVSTPPTLRPQTLLEGVVLEGYAAGSDEFRVEAASAEVDPIASVARLTQVQIEFADRQSGTVLVRAGEGDFAMARDDFTLRKGVVGDTGAGDHFETEDLRYEAATRSLRTESPVRMTRSNLEFRGQGMRFDVDSRRLRFTGRVTATSLPAERP